MKKIIPALLLVILCLSCSRNNSEFERPFVPGTPVVMSPTPEPSPQPVAYPKPSERPLDFLISMDISDESVEWLPQQSTILGKWFQVLSEAGYVFRVGILNSAKDKDGSYDFMPFVKTYEGTLTSGDKDIAQKINSLLLDPKQRKKGSAMQFLSLEIAMQFIRNGFFNPSANHIFYSFSTYPESYYPTKPSPLNVGTTLSTVLTIFQGEQTAYLSAVLPADAYRLWTSNVLANLSWGSPKVFTTGIGSMNDTPISPALTYPIEKIFGPDAVPKL